MRLRAHRILVCLDRSPFSDVTLAHAIAIAQTFGSEVSLLHVMEPRREHPGPSTTDALAWEISRQEARAYLDRHEQAAAQALGRPVEVRLEQGHPAERIVELARELGADLTVLGSHGEGGATAWNLGSTVQQVLAVTRGSVLVARAPAAGPVAAALKRTLVPLDGSLRTESAVPTAARLASASGGELLLVHVVREPVPSSVLSTSEDLELAGRLAAHLEASAWRYLDTVRDRLAHEVAAVRTLVVRHPNERRCLLELARREGVDLVVLSAHGAACDPARTLGSVTAHLLTHATVPLLVLQDLAHEPDRPPEGAELHAPPLRASYPPEAV
ncbi:MAG TPA: universal stress protein [Kofleriaceae bacterium]|nr:universal stress protein [Kofleriaceae bacterium]